MKRTRQLPTVVLPRSRRSAIELLTSPSALPRMMRARALNDAGNDRLRANELSFVRSSSDTTKSAFGLPLVSAVSPLKRYRSGLPYSCPLIAGQDTSSWRAASSPASIRGGSQAGGHRRVQRLDGQRPNGPAIEDGTRSPRRNLKRAARMLLSLMRGDRPASDCVGVGYELMIRGSSLTSEHRLASPRRAACDFLRARCRAGKFRCCPEPPTRSRRRHSGSVASRRASVKAACVLQRRRSRPVRSGLW